MQEKNIVEQAFIQLKQVEDAVSENAKGILSSVMKEEINQLVKESLSEQEEVEPKTDVDIDVDTDSDVDDAGDAENQRQPGRQQEQHHSELNAVQELFGEKDVVHSFPGRP